MAFPCIKSVMFSRKWKPWFFKCFNKRFTLFFISGKHVPPGSISFSEFLLLVLLVLLFCRGRRSNSYGSQCSVCFLHEIFTSIKRIKLKFVHHDFMYGFMHHMVTLTTHTPIWEWEKSAQLLATHTHKPIHVSKTHWRDGWMDGWCYVRTYGPARAAKQHLISFVIVTKHCNNK